MEESNKSLIAVIIILILGCVGVIIWMSFAIINYKQCINSENTLCPRYSCPQPLQGTGMYNAYRFANNGEIIYQ